MLPHTADTVIIGGGVIGASIAYYLSKKKVRAVLLEQGELVSGTSSACGGLIFLQSKKTGAHLALALESKKRFAGLNEELGAEIEYRNEGGLIIVEKEEELQSIDCHIAREKKLGLEVSFLDRQEARELEPCLSENFVAAVHCPLDGQVNPIYLSLAFLEAAKRSGVKVFPLTRVTDIGLGEGRVESVITCRGKIATPIIINAAGVNAPDVGKMVKTKIPIIPRRGQVVVTETGPQLLKRGLISAKYLEVKQAAGLGEAQEGGTSAEQTMSGNFLLGATREFVGFDKRTTWKAMKTIVYRATQLIPGLKDLHIIRTFAGLRPYTPDGLPILGKVTGIDGLIIAAGHEGDGICLAPITGELIADLVTEGRTDFELGDFALDRFEEKRDGRLED
ncbi:MAG: FAD-binding oxidoreductase [Deltaproteobacteria bacterium]|nr:MAG: FAD-binding oxidoreductase [Deltaproteobacteria bacterium]